jgi:DNA processing protein
MPADLVAELQGACAECLRRSWLLATLGARLDYRCGDPERLLELLALGDDALLAALAGGRREELEDSYAQFDPAEHPQADGVESVCVHDGRFPRALQGTWAPRSLNVAGGVERLGELTTAPVVAVVGSRRATDYGMEMAKSLARGLAVSGVTVASGLADGIAVAAHAGALEVEGRTVAVMGGGLDVACPARRRSLYERVRERGCAVAELPCGSPGRRWGGSASARIITGLAELAVVVEADDSLGELASARIAQALGRTVAAVPGRVTSQTSRGAHALLREGAHLVRDPGDVLELLCGSWATPPRTSSSALAGLEPRLKEMLASVGAGGDTLGKLTREGRDAREVLLALVELELMGLLGRGDGGRYVPRQALPTTGGG